MIISRPAATFLGSPPDIRILIEPKTMIIRAMPPARPMAIVKTRPAKAVGSPAFISPIAVLHTPPGQGFSPGSPLKFPSALSDITIPPSVIFMVKVLSMLFSSINPTPSVYVPFWVRLNVLWALPEGGTGKFVGLLVFMFVPSGAFPLSSKSYVFLASVPGWRNPVIVTVNDFPEFVRDTLISDEEAGWTLNDLLPNSFSVPPCSMDIRIL